jgi:hypothetical protein
LWVHTPVLGFIRSLEILGRKKEPFIDVRLAELIVGKLFASVSNYLAFFLIILSEFGFLLLNHFNWDLLHLFLIKK